MIIFMLHLNKVPSFHKCADKVAITYIFIFNKIEIKVN